jgi:hypothetical protein
VKIGETYFGKNKDGTTIIVTVKEIEETEDGYIFGFKAHNKYSPKISFISKRNIYNRVNTFKMKRIEHIKEAVIYAL